MSCKILISAGEVSGDQHLARVVRALKASGSPCQIRGMAGRYCLEAGAQLDLDCYKTGAGMGFFELFRSGGKVISSFKTLSSIIKDWRPDLLLLVDYPDFNLRLAKVAKRFGVRVMYFIPPKVWAWRSSRVKQIKRYVDCVAAIFPFEPGFYERHGYTQVRYVGHPLGDRKGELVSELSRENRLLLLPGSRRFEVERLLVPMLRAFELLKPRYPALKPVVVLAPNIDPEWIKKLVSKSVSGDTINAVSWSHEDALTAMRSSHVGVLKSGTCNLEAAMAGLPFVCVYSGTLLAKVIVSLLVALKEYSPVNIIRPKTVVEVMQHQLSAEDVARSLEPLLNDGVERSEVEAGLRSVRDALSNANGADSSSTVAERVARLALSLISSGKV